MTADAFLRLSDDPAALDGYGPITAASARALLAVDATLRLAITDPAGRLAYLSRSTRLADGRLAEHVISRDQVCQMLGCNTRAERCDLDHIRKHRDGGPTCACNLAPLCRRHHRMKDTGGWQLTRRGEQHVWITPTGRVYPIRPETINPAAFPDPVIPACLGCTVHPHTAPPPHTTLEADAEPEPEPEPEPVTELPCPF
jgi:hypothetical protein